MKLEVTVCDVCADRAEPTQHFAIVNALGTAELDLCETHAEPLIDLMNLAAKRDAGEAEEEPAPKRTNRGRSRVVSLEEIEALKQQEHEGD